MFPSILVTILLLKESRTEDLFVGTKEITAASGDTVQAQGGGDIGSQCVLSMPVPRMGFQPPKQALWKNKGV